ncbi:MAG: DUF1566 domain-containing protein [Fusobacterium sp.]|nr:DUF1566 domain-containing protein [Fusobacterium sp.]
MAEILLSLTIIGVVAAITLPSLTGNINERTWNTQRKALYARMSQAIALMPALNGYGTFAAATASSSAVDNVAETFITSGLSKVLKINNICDTEHVWDCGMASKITTLGGNTSDLPMTLSDLNSGLLEKATSLNMIVANPAAFETANGESILTFYNPNCTAPDVLYQGQDVEGNQGNYVKQQVCANMVFDLNGSKGPNTVGKDIGIMSIIYSSDSVVVMPLQPKIMNQSKKYAEASKLCKDNDSESRMPNIEELLSMYYNRQLFDWDGGFTWSSTNIDKDTAWVFGYYGGIKYPTAKDKSRYVICVKRN